jgi:uncharacterized hydrophobic protein (TIGR00271 family)
MRETIVMSQQASTSATRGSPDSAQADGDQAFQILVPVGSAAAVRRTAPIALQVARARGGSVTFLTVRRLRYDIVDLPDRVPDWLRDAVEALETNDTEVGASARLGQSVVGAIRAVARELEAKLLLLHWESDEVTIPRAERTAFEELIQRPPCTALLLRGRYAPGDSPSIIATTAGGAAAIDVATSLLEAAGRGTLRMLQVVETKATDEQVRHAAETARAQLPEARGGIDVDVIVRRAASYEGAVLEELAADEADLAIAGALREGVIRRLSRIRLPERLLRPAPTPALIVSTPEARPLTIFHRLWTPIYGRAPSLKEDEKIAVYMQLRRAARADADYHVMMVLAAAVAALGLLLDSTAVVIGAMLLAPLMSPIAGAALGVVQGDAKLIRLSVGSVVSGTLAATVTALATAFILPGAEVTAEFTARTEPGLLDLLVALGSGMAAAYAISRPGMSASLPGVAVAAALVPPLAAVAVGIALGEWTDSAGAALLFSTNLAAIAAASALTFLWIGFRPDADRAGRFGVFGRGVVWLTVLLVAVSVPIGILTARALDADALASRAHDSLAAASAELEGVEVASATVDRSGDALTVHATLLAEGPLLPEQAASLRRALERDLGSPVVLEVEVTQLVRDGP